MKILIQDERTVEISGVTYRLSLAEVLILTSMLESKGNPFSRDELLNIGWKERVVSQNSLTVAIGNIRKVINVNEELIITLPKEGYKIDGDVSIISSITDGIPSSLNKDGIRFFGISRFFRVLLSKVSVIVISFSVLLLVFLFIGRSLLIENERLVRAYSVVNSNVVVVVTSEMADKQLVDKNIWLSKLEIKKGEYMYLSDNYELVVIVNTFQRLFIIDCIVGERVKSHVTFDKNKIMSIVTSGVC